MCVSSVGWSTQIAMTSVTHAQESRTLVKNLSLILLLAIQTLPFICNYMELVRNQNISTLYSVTFFTHWNIL